MSARAFPRRIACAVLMGGVALVSGCSERPQVIVYDQGTYQGKTDTPPWTGAAFAGDAEKWRDALDRRTQGQNDYARIR